METDEFLAHFGVKGMKWGQRKAPVSERQQLNNNLQKLVKRRDKFNGNTIFEGHINSSYGEWRGLPRKDGTSRVFWASKNADTTRRIAKGRFAVEGLIGTGLVAGVGGLLVSQTAYSPQAKQGAQISLAILAATTYALPTIQNIHSVNVAKKHDQVLTDIYQTQKAIKALDKKRKGS